MKILRYLVIFFAAYNIGHVFSYLYSTSPNLLINLFLGVALTLCLALESSDDKTK